MEDIVIVSAVRTPVGKFGGTLAKTAATDLGAIVIKEALARAKVGTYSSTDVRGLEALATYWHATDLVWLMIFALFYALV